MRLAVGPRPHDLLNFELSHLVLSKCHIVDKETPAELIGNYGRDYGPPSNAEDHIEGDAQGSYPAKLVMSAQVVDCDAADCQTIGEEAEGDVPGVLLLLLRQHILVWVVLEFRALRHCTLPNHFLLDSDLI